VGPRAFMDFWVGENLLVCRDPKLICPFLSLVTVPLTLFRVLHHLLLRSVTLRFFTQCAHVSCTVTAVIKYFLVQANPKDI
jgi:hypothetical protein